ncbi:hypothetical protein D917_07725 [Trichinella nativa]|uniref:Vinculin-binding site-containing domain-containing protein n=1 Tax=Trichinella nativa TaxID=6335 RepID=A0A1Y3END9_9BILA|nr:hypothetical protein D917_07725 [Trichinella nativa]
MSCQPAGPFLETRFGLQCPTYDRGSGDGFGGFAIRRSWHTSLHQCSFYSQRYNWRFGYDDHVFSDHREAILRTAKALVEDTKALVSGAASSQEQLAVAAQNAVRTIVQLSEVVKSGAAALTSSNSEAQVLVINAVKDVAAALSHLIQATKSASGKSFNDPAMNSLKEAAKVMVTNVTSLLKTVKTVEDEHQRGTRALEAAIEAIGQEIRAYDSSEQPTREAKPEELIRVTKPITDATAKAVAAGQSCQQDDVIAAANMSRRVVSDLLNSCRAVAFWAETPDARYRCLDAGRDVAIKVRELLQALNTVRLFICLFSLIHFIQWNSVIMRWALGADYLDCYNRVCIHVDLVY